MKNNENTGLRKNSLISPSDVELQSAETLHKNAS